MITIRLTISLVALGASLAGPSRTVGGQELADSVVVPRYIPRWSVGAVSVQLGTAHLGLDELNTMLAAHERPAFSTDAATFGVSAYARFDRFIIGGSGETALPQRATQGGWKNRISFGSAMLDAGIALVDRPRLFVQSLASIGVRRSSLRMEQRDDVAYDDVLRDPARGSSLSSTSALAGIGMAAELRLATRATGAFSIGVRAGISRPFGSPATRAGENSVSDAPRESSGRYLRLSIGKPIGRKRDAVRALSTALLSIVTQ